MNKFRNSLVAVATAFAVTTAGVSVASAQETETNTSSAGDIFGDLSSDKDDTTTPPENGEKDNGSSDYFFDEDGEFDIKKVTGIFSLITGAIGVLTAVYTFVNRFTK